MNAGLFAPLIAEFNRNWSAGMPNLELQMDAYEIELKLDHPIYGELAALCSGRAGSLPYFSNHEVIWCTMAPNGDALRAAVVDLQAWILPSFGGEGQGDGYVEPRTTRGALATAIISVSPGGYYRWRCRRADYHRVIDKFTLYRGLEARCPTRTRPPRPSLYELRARFATALLVGDRNGAEHAIELLDTLQLDTAVNTQFMRIRLWHHFREYDRIRHHPQLDQLLTQALPPRVQSWIDEAIGADQATPYAPPVATPSAFTPPSVYGWADWFDFVRRGDKAAAELFVSDHEAVHSADDLTPTAIGALEAGMDELYLDDSLRTRERQLIVEGIALLLDKFVREPEFPRANLADLYLALLRLWCALYAGTSAGREHGHVLLELANATLQLNCAQKEVCEILERWWTARPVRGQLPFALDAIELLDREFPGTEATANLWLGAAGVIQRSADALPPSDLALWRSAGVHLGFDELTISRYLPPAPVQDEQSDPLAAAQLQHVAIVCIREAQAREAAHVIRRRTNAHVTVVADKTAGDATSRARHANVVLFVWMAASHAVFRAFDGFDRRRFCYVQGTGSSSIVRTLERWIISRGSVEED